MFFGFAMAVVLTPKSYYRLGIIFYGFAIFCLVTRLINIAIYYKIILEPVEKIDSFSELKTLRIQLTLMDVMMLVLTFLPIVIGTCYCFLRYCCCECWPECIRGSFDCCKSCYRHTFHYSQTQSHNPIVTIQVDSDEEDLKKTYGSMV